MFLGDDMKHYFRWFVVVVMIIQTIMMFAVVHLLDSIDWHLLMGG